MNLTASILTAAGAGIPADARFQGMNLLPILEGRMPEAERTLFWRTAAGNRLQEAVRRGNWNLVVDGNHTYLFDLRTDLAKRHDMPAGIKPLRTPCGCFSTTGSATFGRKPSSER